MKLEAIILAAGSGSRMLELTRGRPKCLLPVGNHSLIWFAITGLKMVGVSRIILLIPDSHEADIKQYCHKKFNSKDIKLEFVTVPAGKDRGTAESILSISDRLRQDFIVYSCDAIVDPRALLGLVNHYRLYDPMLSMLLSDNANYFQPKSVPGRREKEHNMRDVIALEPLDKLELTASSGFYANKIVFFHSERELKQNLKIKNRELALHPSLEVCSKFLDTHIYIFKRQMIDFLRQNNDKEFLKAEVIPLLISKQFSKLDKKVDGDNNDDDDVRELKRSTSQFDYEDELSRRLEKFKPREDYSHEPNLMKSRACHALVAKNLHAHRANTLGNYLDCNREAKTLLAVFGQKNLNTCKDCIVGENTKIGEKCLLKRGSIGSNCKIGDKVKLFDCVIMDNVEIGSNANLSECIVSSMSRIGTKCDLKSCIIGQNVPNGTKMNGEVLIEEGMIDLSDPLLVENEPIA